MEKVSQSKKKLLNYLDVFIDADDFQGNIGELRKKFKIPKAGFKFSKEKQDKLLAENLLTELFFIMYIAEELKGVENDIAIINDVNKSLFEVAKKFPIYDPAILFVLKCYLFYNERMYDFLGGKIHDVDMCKVVDIVQDVDDYAPFHPWGFGCFKKAYEDYPVVIKLHPSTTQRDLNDYIVKNWSKIKACLGKYEEDEHRLGKFRNRDAHIKERNDFIYENRNLPLKNLGRLVADQFDDFLDDGHISKIIHSEIERRKEV